MATKVSQATIDKIKKMGMSAALKSAPKANAEMTEALRRMYGQKRLDAATKSAKPARPIMGRPSALASKAAAPSAISGKKLPATASPTAVSKTSTRPSGQQIAQAKARSGMNSIYSPTSAKVEKPKSKPYVAPKPTAQQLAQAKLRSGNVGGSKMKDFTFTKPLSASQKKAVAEALKKAKGRTV